MNVVLSDRIDYLMKIIIFTDSLGRPRPNINSVEKTDIDDVYGEIIKEYFNGVHKIELIYIESLDSIDAIFWSHRMVAFRKPDVVIFHFGINDCAPRLLKKNSNSIILSPFFRKLTFDFFLRAMGKMRYEITKYNKKVYVPVEKMIENLSEIESEILKYNQKALFYFMSIATSSEMDSKSYGYNRNIKKYNSELAGKYKENYIDVDSVIGGDGLISDCVHLTKESHQLLSIKLIKIIEELY